MLDVPKRRRFNIPLTYIDEMEQVAKLKNNKIEDK